MLSKLYRAGPFTCVILGLLIGSVFPALGEQSVTDDNDGNALVQAGDSEESPSTSPKSTDKKPSIRQTPSRRFGSSFSPIIHSAKLQQWGDEDYRVHIRGRYLDSADEVKLDAAGDAESGVVLPVVSQSRMKIIADLPTDEITSEGMSMADLVRSSSLKIGVYRNDRRKAAYVIRHIDGHSDRDRDGYMGSDYGGKDCDDRKASVNPEVDEVCDGIDNNCNGLVDRYAESRSAVLDCP